MPNEKHDVHWITEDDIKAQTEKAIMVYNARGEKVWIPVSQINYYPNGDISIPRWLADKKELA